MRELTDENFEKLIRESDKQILVDFFAEWCPPCKALSPILEKLEIEFGEKIIFAKVNVDTSPITAQKLDINPIPTVILFKKGEAAASFVGLLPELEIKNWLEKQIKGN